jgi:hypothetical protein
MAQKNQKASDKKDGKTDSVPKDHTPQPRIFIEKIGDRELHLREESLDVFKDVKLWEKNPRLRPQLPATGTFNDETEVEAALQKSSGYIPLSKSIGDIGQLESVYVWKADAHTKYLVLEGATRVSILRDYARKLGKKPEGARFHRVKAKILPPDFTEIERAILLARIHVRGTGVRGWDRYIQAEFIHEHVSETGNGATTVSVTEMARHMGKSVSWVQRLRDAYSFASKFVDYVDSEDAVKLAAEEFSTLEEIAKASIVGPKLRDYNNTDHDQLRTDVFEMVRNKVFSEYRDARFMKELHEDPDKWALLKTGEKHIAKKLVADLKTNSSSVKVRISGLEQAIERAFERDPDSLNEDDVKILRRAAATIDSRIHSGMRPFRLALLEFTDALVDASLSDVRSVHPDELARFEESLADMKTRLSRHPNLAAAPAPTVTDEAVA